MPKNLKYTVVLIPEEDLPGCVTQGSTRAEALTMAREAIGFYLESLAADGLPTPVERALETAVVGVPAP